MRPMADHQKPGTKLAARLFASPQPGRYNAIELISAHGFPLGQDLVIQRSGRAADPHEDFLRLSEKWKPPRHRALDPEIEFIAGLASRDVGYSKDCVMKRLILEVAGRLLSCRPCSDSHVCAPAFKSLQVFSPTHRPEIDSHRHHEHCCCPVLHD
jgi:hypothetical protein